MFGGVHVKQPKAAPKKLPSSSRNSVIRFLTEKCYRDPYGWGLVKSVAFFAASVIAIRAVSQMDILPAEQSSQ